MLLVVVGLKRKHSQLQEIYSTLKSLSKVVESHSTNRRQRSTSPLPRLSPSQESAMVNNQINETNYNINK